MRRSVRKYKDILISDEKVEALLRAAMQAPSAGNQQPWEFFVVKNPLLLEGLSQVSPFAGLIASAPLVIVLLCNKERLKKPAMWQQDMAAATENLLLEAVEQDLGAVWIGIAPLEDRMAHVSRTLDLREPVVPFSIVAVGVPCEVHANHYVDRFEPSRITYLE
jgi:nitroreductase